MRGHPMRRSSSSRPPEPMRTRSVAEAQAVALGAWASSSKRGLTHEHAVLAEQIHRFAGWFTGYAVAYVRIFDSARAPDSVRSPGPGRRPAGPEPAGRDSARS